MEQDAVQPPRVVGDRGIGRTVARCDGAEAGRQGIDLVAIDQHVQLAKYLAAGLRRFRHGLDHATLVELFAWTAEEFATRMAGSAIRRIGYERWSRNIAVGLGNAPASGAAVAALERRANDPSPLVREHVAWALSRQREVHSAKTSTN